MIEALRNGSWLTAERVRRVAWLALAVAVCVIGFLLVTAKGTLDIQGRPLGTDFSQVYAAGKMVLDGRAAEVWDWPAHFRVQMQVHHAQSLDVYGWHYPPPFLLIATALATQPYLAALFVWQAATLGPLAVVTNRATGLRDGWLFLLAAPVTMVCLMHGHNGFLTALLLGGGLLLLDRRPFVAGLLLGCLVYKPQFALLLPLLLLVARKWPAILGAAISSLGLIAITYVIWGWPVWQAFIDSLALTRDVVIEQGRTGWHKIMSPFAAVRAWGLPIAPAYAVQTVFTVASIAVTLWLAWKGRPALRNAAAAATALIATPYVLDYDYVVLLITVFFLWKDGEKHGWRPWEKSLLALGWMAPLFARQVAEATLVPLGLMAALALLAIAANRGLKASPSRHSHEGSGR